MAGKGLCKGGTAKNCNGKSGIERLKAEGGGDLNLDVYPDRRDVKQTAQMAVLRSLLAE